MGKASLISLLPIHADQLQPYPANLMVGFYARADSAQPIRTDLDNELIGKCPGLRQKIQIHVP